MSKVDVVEILKKSDALLEGHFLLSSGKHSNRYVQCAKVLRFPQYAEQVLSTVVEQIKDLDIDLVVGPAMGGVIVSYELGRQLNKEAVFTERKDGVMQLRRGFEVQPGAKIIISEDAINSELIQNHLKEELQKIDYIQVPSNIFKLISEVEKPQGVLAIIEKEKQEENIDINQDIILALDDLQDPGNLGTIIRTADSIGLKQILISKGTIEAYNPKVIRSTMGAIFRVKIIECENLKETLKRLQKNNFKIMVTDLNTDKSIYDIKLQKKVIIIGNEANGVSEEIKNIADTRAIIPMFGKTESLNASIATGVILYEYVRQKLQEK